MSQLQQSLRDSNRINARDVILDAAELLLERGQSADFSMRELAAEAKVSFATPFNLFGSKGAIMQALSARLIDLMADKFRAAPRRRTAMERVILMGRIASELLLTKSEIYKTVIASLSMPGVAAASVHSVSTTLWLTALGAVSELPPAIHLIGANVLAEQLAYAFRGCISFWIAGELLDADLAMTFERSVLMNFLGISEDHERPEILRRLKRIGKRAKAHS